MENQYKGKTALEVWDAWDEKQRKHFLLDHYDEYESVKETQTGYREMKSMIKQLDSNDGDFFSKHKYVSLPYLIRKSILKHVSQEQYGKGGKTETNKMKTPEDVWNAWNEEQRWHFATDHNIEENVSTRVLKMNSEELKKDDWGKEFNHRTSWDWIVGVLKEHISEGQYGKGGKTETKTNNILDPGGMDWKLLKDRRDIFSEEDIASVEKHGGTPIPKHPYVIHNGLVYLQLGQGGKTKTNQPTEQPMKTFYYIQIGNVIKDKFGSHFRIESHEANGIMAAVHSAAKNFKSEPFHISWEELTEKMKDKTFSIEGHPFETERDKILLMSETNFIKANQELEEHKLLMSNLVAEKDAAKQEANVLTEKLDKKTKAVKDTLEAVGAMKKESLTKSGRVKAKSRLDEFMWDAEELVNKMEDEKGWQIKVTNLLKKKGASENEISEILQDLPRLAGIGDIEMGKGGKIEEWLIEDESGHRKVVEQKNRPKKGDIVTTAESEGGKTTAVTKVIGKPGNIKSGRSGTSKPSPAIRVGKSWHVTFKKVPGTKTCRVPDWATTIAKTIHPAAKVTTCKDKDNNWYVRSVMVKTNGISKAEAKSIATKIHAKIVKP